MNIKYLWVEEFRNLKNIGLNFSGDLIIEYDKETSSLTKRKTNEAELKDFFGRNISSLSAMVGENGVGKTSVFLLLQVAFNALKELYGRRTIEDHLPLRSKRLTNDKLSYVLVVEVGGNYQYYANNSKVKHSENISDIQASLYGAIESTELMYYSNSFDYSDHSKYQNVLDISTNAFVGYAVDQMIERFNTQENFMTDRSFLYNYKTREIREQLEFLIGFQEKIPVDMPSKLAFRVSQTEEKSDVLPHYLYALNNNENELDDLEDEDEEMISYNRASSILTLLLEKFETDQDKSRGTPTSFYLKRSLQYTALYNYIAHFLYVSTSVVGHYEFQFDVQLVIPKLESVINNDPDNLFISAFDIFSEFTKVKISGTRVLEWINDLVNFSSKGSTSENTVHFEIGPETKDQIKALAEDYFSLGFFPSFVDFYWEGISAGENAILTLFSRLYSYRQWSREQTSIILLLDECEVNFHPNWQRKLVSLINSFLPKIFPSSQIQVILSSHSPIILSDIPRSNVIFLRRDEEGTQVSSLEEKRQTFAANIHTLYSDAFFMQEGLLGEFAKSKINGIIDTLTSRYQEVEKASDEIRTIIDLVGEPLIRTKLRQLLDEKLSLSIYDLRNRIEKLEAGQKRRR